MSYIPASRADLEDYVWRILPPQNKFSEKGRVIMFHPGAAGTVCVGKIEKIPTEHLLMLAREHGQDLAGTFSKAIEEAGKIGIGVTIEGKRHQP